MLYICTNISQSCKNSLKYDLLVNKIILKNSHPVIANKPSVVEICSPNVCGPYSNCREVNGHAVCSCQAGYIGMPPNCRAECVVSSDCTQDKACINQKCANPCAPQTCADNAICKVVNHNPICSCTPGFTGDPFVRCIRRERKLTFFLPASPNTFRFCDYCLANVNSNYKISK